MSWNQIVKKIVNGDQVSAEEVNPILSALADRDQYLFNQLGQYQAKSVLMGYNLLVNPTTSPIVGDVVFYKPDVGLTAAKVGFDADFSVTHFAPMQDSYAFGIVYDISSVDGGSVATIYLQGLVENLNITNMLVAGETFTAGPLYLSKSEAGKLTSHPGGLTVFVGYAISNTSMLLHPNYDSLNQLFFNYKFDLVDRVAGIPTLTSTTWTVGFPDTSKVGWIAVASSPYASVAPAGAVFWYNLPAEDTIQADVSLTAGEKTQAIALKHALPPYPHHYTSVYINGVLQHSYDADHTGGSYIVDNAGLWWMKDQDESQPWASDIKTKGLITFNTSTNVVNRVAHGFIAGQPVSFLSSTGALPANLALNTVYYVSATSLATDTFRISATNGGSALVLGSLVGTPTLMLSWLSTKGSTQLRPQQQLTFIKLNPDYKAAVVTSIQPYIDGSVDTSKVLKLISADDRVTETNVGDLLVKVEVNTSLAIQSPLTSKAVKSVTFNNLTGTLEVLESNVVTAISGTEGLTVVTATDGVTTISLANFTASGEVVDVEPEDCDYVYKGLHSYLRLKNPVGTAKTGFVGKIKLPNSIPADKPLKVKLLLFGSTTSGNSAKFKFEYSVSAPGLITDAVTRTNSGGDILVTAFTANTSSLVSNAYFQIPASALSVDGYANFRLSRVYSADYTGDIGVLAVNWAIE